MFLHLLSGIFYFDIVHKHFFDFAIAFQIFFHWFLNDFSYFRKAFSCENASTIAFTAWEALFIDLGAFTL